MADFLKDATDWLGQQLESHASRAITYTRGSDLVTLSAVVGSTPFRVDDIGQGTTRIVRSDRDYLIRADSLILNGVAVTPRRGDRIVDSVDGKTYECQPIVDGEPAWRNSDPYGEVYRIHCNRVT